MASLSGSRDGHGGWPLRAIVLGLTGLAHGALAQPAVLALDPAAEPATDPGRRVRLGFSVDGGLHGPSLMGTFGAEGHVGFQVTRWFGVLGVVGGTFGFGAGTTRLAYGYAGPAAELFFADLFYLGAGPVLALGSLSSPEFSTSGFVPGVDVRLGLGFGRARRGWFGRGGLNVGLDALLLVHPGAQLSFVPMLKVGYEWR